jgi:glycosyltransferase involved in cell wall biosynthesis
MSFRPGYYPDLLHPSSFLLHPFFLAEPLQTARPGEGVNYRTYDLSVVISTFNRCDQLGRALDALLAQATHAPFEVIVVDNNSTDATKAVVAERLSRAPNMRYVFEPTQGLPHARNAGILASSAPIVAFTDDDVEVGPEWVDTIKRTFDAHPDVDMLGGRVRPIWPERVPNWVTRRQLGPFALGERGDTPIRVSKDNAAPCLVGANFAFRREVFDRVGLFDPAYTKSQDREIQLRLWRAGGVGLYVPSLAIRVDVPAERLTKKYFRYWYTIYGVYHSRMGLLDALDRDGRLVEPQGRRLFGTPAFILRQLLDSGLRWAASLLRFDTVTAFYWENQFRYRWSYVRERYRSRREGQGSSALAELRQFVSALTERRHRPAA